MAGMDSTGEDNSMDTLDQTFAEVAEVYRNLGAKNIDFGWNEDSTVLFLSYDFDNVETINKILQEDKESDLFGGKKEGSKAQFTVKGKNKLIYEAAEMEEDTTMSSDEMESMKEYYQYKLAFSFEKDIKKMKNENAVMSPDGKSFEFSGSMFDILSEDYSTDFTVKLK